MPNDATVNKIKVFTNTNVKALEEEVNTFIADKVVQNIWFNKADAISSERIVVWYKVEPPTP